MSKGEPQSNDDRRMLDRATIESTEAARRNATYTLWTAVASFAAVAVALASTVVSAFFARWSALDSHASAQAALDTLAQERQPILFATCAVPDQGAIDYQVRVSRGSEDDEILATSHAVRFPNGTSFKICDVTSEGRLPLLNVTLYVGVASATTTIGEAIANYQMTGSKLRKVLAVRVPTIAPGETKRIAFYNCSPNDYAAGGFTGDVDLFTAPYRDLTRYTLPGVGFRAHSDFELSQGRERGRCIAM
jgi:hypothetical protein